MTPEYLIFGTFALNFNELKSKKENQLSKGKEG